MGCGNIDALGDRSENFIGCGVYVKQVRMYPGWTVIQHAHKYDHLAIIPGEGRAVLTVDGHSQRLQGPCAVVIGAGKKHSVMALSSLLWQCVHRVDPNEKDAEKIDRELIINELPRV